MCRSTSKLSRRSLLAGVAILPLMGAPRARAETPPAPVLDLPKPGPRDTCPVCGMFVEPYRDWWATVVYDDGLAHHFDGAKDLFKYLADVPKYAPGRSAQAITAMGVTDYYGVTMIDARAARYVIGSDVLGPMGHELVPLASDAEAADFLKDHLGQRQVSADQVTPALLVGLDQGRFE